VWNTFVVLTPDTEEEMAGLVKGCIDLGLTIVPRGGGTGYTGGAIPLTWKSAVINTENLGARGEMVDLPGIAHKVPTIYTKPVWSPSDVADAAERGGLCLRWTHVCRSFMHWRQLAMNAGGKNVLWGTPRQRPAGACHPDAGGSTSFAWTTTSAVHDADMAARFEVLPSRRQSIRPPRAPHFPASLSAKKAWAKRDRQVLPAVARRAKRLRWFDPGTLDLAPHACTRTVCMEFFGNAKDLCQTS
jgi:hypothetical protein